jgi:uncharacterized protein
VISDVAKGTDGVAIAVMAKAPRPGEVKTRLAPPLALETASALSASFLRDITENIALAADGMRIHPYVAYAPARSTAFFEGKIAGGTRLVLADGAGVKASAVLGLGCCLLHAAQSLLAAGHDAVCLVNADSPTLPTALLRRAASALAEDGDRLVLGPAEDGGYYLIGMKTPHPQLFADIAWSTSRVAEETRQRAKALGLPVVELDPWYDVDDVPSLYRLCLELTIGESKNGLDPFPAPATARCIARLGIPEFLGAQSPPGK